MDCVFSLSSMTRVCRNFFLKFGENWGDFAPFPRIFFPLYILRSKNYFLVMHLEGTILFSIYSIRIWLVWGLIFFLFPFFDKTFLDSYFFYLFKDIWNFNFDFDLLYELLLIKEFLCSCRSINQENWAVNLFFEGLRDSKNLNFFRLNFFLSTKLFFLSKGLWDLCLDSMKLQRLVYD